MIYVVEYGPVAAATESGEHARIVLDYIEEDRNCIIEKPIALSLAGAEAVIEVAEHKDVKVCDVR